MNIVLIESLGGHCQLGRSLKERGMWTFLKLLLVWLLRRNRDKSKVWHVVVYIHLFGKDNLIWPTFHLCVCFFTLHVLQNHSIKLNFFCFAFQLDL